MQSVAKHLCYNKSFITNNYLFEMIKKNHFYHFFCIHTPSRHKIQVPKGLAEEMFSIRHYIKTLNKNAADKIWKTPYEVYDIYILV